MRQRSNEIQFGGAVADQNLAAKEGQGLIPILLAERHVFIWYRKGPLASTTPILFSLAHSLQLS